MNSKQIQYAVMLSQVLNFSQLAEQLNISQPALSKQIISLEHELGVKLFDRNTNPMTLTAAGEHFVKDAKELLYKEEQMLRSMEDFKTGEKGSLVIGISPFRCLYLIPDIVKKLRQKFPGLQVILKEAGRSDQLRKGIAEGQYDFAIINLPVDDSLLDVNPLEPELLVLAVPEQMAQTMKYEKNNEKNSYPLVDLSDCEELPFIVLSNQQELRKSFDKLCSLSKIRPNICAEVIGITTAWAMVRSGVGATILPLTFVRDSHFEEGISLFMLKNSTSVRHPAIVTRKGQYISKYAEYAIKLLLDN
ncbi:MAG: LysR family transcriptional regulator [Anaerofustis stercorihominis]|nr:LysR family transcriptional regulator [Anaerofustis stercorihominis]